MSGSSTGCAGTTITVRVAYGGVGPRRAAVGQSWQLGILEGVEEVAGDEEGADDGDVVA